MLGTLGRKYGLHASKSLKEKGIVELLSTYERTSDELGELESPAGDENSISKIIKAREEAAENVKADPGTALVSKVQFKQADELANAYGLNRCIS